MDASSSGFLLSVTDLPMRTPATRAILSVPLALLCFVSMASAKIIYVNRTASGTNSGTSWANAYPTLQAAINSAISGDQVWVATGTYRPNDANPSNLSRTQTFSMKTGIAVYGGFAGTESMLAERNPALYPVTLSGDLLGDDSAAGTLAVSSPITTGDNALRVITNSSVTSTGVLDSVIIRGGNADGTNTTTSGAGMYNSSGAPTLTNCVFVDNRAALGAAMYNSLSSPVLTGCTLCFNTATSQGGAIYNSRTPAMMLVNCTLANNSAPIAGAIMNSISTMIAINTTVAHNSSDVITSGNPSCSGIRSVLSANKSSQSNLYLYNCILWGNLNSVQIFGGNTTASNCIIQGGYTGTAPTLETYVLANILDVDPLITQLGNHGGPAPVIISSAGSPAINQGIATVQTPLSIPTTDQRGIPRDSQPDIGATEYPIHVPTGAYSPEIAISGNAILPVTTSLDSPTYQWYRGTTGDMSSPISGATAASYTTPPLGIGTDFWVAITSGGETQASPTVSVQVRGTYPQWAAFHGLQGVDALPDACPALDGLANIVKFATGLDPFVPALQSAFLQTSTNSIDGQFHLDLILSRTPTDVTWDILEFTQPSDWTPTTTTAIPSRTTTARLTQRLTVPTSTPGRMFRARFVAVP